MHSTIQINDTISKLFEVCFYMLEILSFSSEQYKQFIIKIHVIIYIRKRIDKNIQNILIYIIKITDNLFTL